MVWLRLLGGIGSLLVVALVVGSLATLALGLAGDTAAAAVVALLALVALALAANGRRFDGGSGYW
jgi:hypothetical protein